MTTTELVKPEKRETASLINALSFRRVVPVVLLTMIFVLAVRQSAMLDPDVWWHLKAGEHIVKSHHVPHTDDFSFTKQGSEWVAHEWLSEVLMYGLFRLIGLTGLVCVFSSVIVVSFWITYRRSDGRPYMACIALLLAAAASSPLLGIRPQMLTLLLSSIYIYILEAFVRDGQKKRLWFLPPLMLLWVNLHAGFALGLALIGLYVICIILDGEWTRLRMVIVLLLVCTALVPLNPNSVRMFSYPFETLTSPSMAAFIQEWASPDFHKVTYLPLLILLLTTFGALALSPKPRKASEVFLVLVTALGALRSVRHIPIFTLFAAPVLSKSLWSIAKAHNWDRLLDGEQVRTTGLKLVINILLLIAPLVLVTSRIWHFATHERSYEAIRNPVGAVDFIQQNRLPQQIYNRYGWGGYLIYRLYPDYRVYIDGRADVYGDEFFSRAMKTDDGLGRWKEELDQSNINTILIAPDITLARLLKNSSDWQVRYEDRDSIIFTRVPH